MRPSCGAGFVASGILFFSLSLVLAPAGAALAEDTVDPKKRTIGAVEEVLVIPPGITLKARVDTGAAISSLDARDVVVRRRGIARIVRFTLVGDGGQRYSLELPVAERVVIASADGGRERRPAVRMDVCVGGLRAPIEVTLNDRAGVEYRMLLGRNLLEGRFVVDVARAFTSPPGCLVGP